MRRQARRWEFGDSLYEREKQGEPPRYAYSPRNEGRERGEATTGSVEMRMRLGIAFGGENECQQELVTEIKGQDGKKAVRVDLHDLVEVILGRGKGKPIRAWKRTKDGDWIFDFLNEQ